MFHALFLLIIMLLAGRLIAFVPMAALAAILLVVAWGMSEADHFIAMARTFLGRPCAWLCGCGPWATPPPTKIGALREP